MKTQRLDKIVSHVLNITRSEAQTKIRTGQVSVNGKAVIKASEHFDMDKDKIEINGQGCNHSSFVYIMMNKPAGVLSAARDKKAKTVIDLIPSEMRRKGLFPAGRLDKDTVGLLLITDDGKLAHEILAPRKHIFKTYFVRVDKPLEKEDIQAFKNGAVLEDGTLCKSAQLEITGECEGFIKISEGKFHQIKRMFLSVGKSVVYLKRTAMGALCLDEALQEGECRYLTEEEKQLLRENME
ncbi:MAG: 16S rRNA pseudouridine(516) synthase [Ruminococcaceae bacterium]|nr:16S rRNA pseudouridine(516) synthase [Oscillospiraceae bacterium]